MDELFGPEKLRGVIDTNGLDFVARRGRRTEQRTTDINRGLEKAERAIQRI